MLTIFATPKAFKGRFDRIQRNAITSWCRLRPRPEVILFGDDPGTAELAAELGLRHEPEVRRNAYNTPLVSDIFIRAQEVASNDLMAYVNSDIILMDDFMKGVTSVADQLDGQPFLGVGRKTNFEIDRLIDFDDPAWQDQLRAEARAEGREVTFDSDFFVFRRGFWPTMPEFAIGRCYWSSWFMYDARRRGVAMVDMTPSVLSIESKHDYSHALSTGGHARLSGVEYEGNRKLFRGCRYFTTANATAILEDGRLAPPPPGNRWLEKRIRLTYWVYFLLKGRTYPYSLPLILLGRWALAAARAVTDRPRRAQRASS